jgi:hypothetical protein
VHAKHRQVGATALAAETVLVRERGSGTRLLMERFFANARVTPRIGMEMGSNETIKQAVIAGLGIAFISAHRFIVNLARKRLLPSAAALRQFMMGEGRAFSVACYAFANGAERIIPVADIDEARRLKLAHPEFVTLGERHARKLEGFDFGNSPTHIEHEDFTGRTLVQTTHAGTQGLVNASEAEVVITGGLVNAAAICRYIARLAPVRGEPRAHGAGCA